jgi:hypothetical protein
MLEILEFAGVAVFPGGIDAAYSALAPDCLTSLA